jgi:hypothetical protein
VEGCYLVCHFCMLVSIRRAALRVCVRVFFLVSPDPLLFASRWSRHLIEDHNPSFIFKAARDI